jgi:hypothetical protein
MKTLKYIFSTTQAIWPVREKMMRAVRNLALPVFFMAVSFQRDGFWGIIKREDRFDPISVSGEADSG